MKKKLLLLIIIAGFIACVSPQVNKELKGDFLYIPKSTSELKENGYVYSYNDIYAKKKGDTLFQVQPLGSGNKLYSLTYYIFRDSSRVDFKNFVGINKIDSLYTIDNECSILYIQENVLFTTFSITKSSINKYSKTLDFRNLVEKSGNKESLEILQMKMGGTNDLKIEEAMRRVRQVKVQVSLSFYTDAPLPPSQVKPNRENAQKRQ